jgi:hypothetical protein
MKADYEEQGEAGEKEDVVTLGQLESYQSQLS